MFRLTSQDLERIASQWKDAPVGLVYLDIERFYELEEKRGRAFCEHVLASIKAKIYELRSEIPSLAAVNTVGDDFFFFVSLSPLQTEERRGKDLRETGMRIKLLLERHLRGLFGGSPAVEFHLGTAQLSPPEDEDIEKTIYIATKRAIREAKRYGESAGSSSEINEFLAIMENQAIYSVYQPIVSFDDAQIFGYEALTRGPAGSPLHSPLELFRLAERENLLYTLDRLAREKAIEGCRELKPNQRVFINIPANVIHDPHFTPGQTLKLLERRGLKPHNVVFEITERSSIEDFSTTKKILQHYRSQGYQIAIDDAGAGYSSLQAIAELQPDFIKVDRSLIHGIHKDKMKETILETFVSFSEKMNIRIIAEGIEQMEELAKLMQMGVHLGQGYLLARPQVNMIGLDEQLTDQILLRRRLRNANGLYSIGHIAAPLKTFEPDTHISEVTNYFKANENVLGAVVADRSVPVGLVMRDKLFKQLAGQYGVSLYWNRPISQVMDRSPLIVDEHLPLDQVSEMATSREINNLYDYVIITSDGKLLGAASIRSILESITKVRVEQARIANPLTGLPGNVQIRREMNKRLLDGQKFSVIYADLDFFKWFNDRYGFHKGDQLIQFTADVLQEASRVCGDPYDFVGHIGGDDFIVMTNADSPKLLCEEILRRFEQGIKAFYEEPDRQTVVDREGNHVQADGVSISLSLIICECCTGLTAEFISQEAAKLKKQAKAHLGSVYVYRHLGKSPGEVGAPFNGKNRMNLEHRQVSSRRCE